MVGKSHSGRLPATGLYTQFASVPPPLIGRQGGVGRADEVASRHQGAALEQLERGTFAVRQISRPGGRGVIRHCSAMAVLPRYRRARPCPAAARTAGTAAARPPPAWQRALGEGARRAGREPHPQHPGAVRGGTSSASGSTGSSVSSCASITTLPPSPSQASAIAPTRNSSAAAGRAGRRPERGRSCGRDVRVFRWCAAAPRPVARRCARPAGLPGTSPGQRWSRGHWKSPAEYVRLPGRPTEPDHLSGGS